MPDVGSNSPLDREKTAKAVQEKSTFSKLLREALSRSLEFLDIIQSHSPERRNSFQEMAPGKETSPNTRPGIVFKLNLLSVYLQLVMIYEKIIHLLRACLLEELLVEIPDLEIAPGGQMGNNMQIKLLIHAILHQFELIEQILGLPAECRVTDKDGVYPGVRLLEDSNTKSLLEAVGFGKGSEVTGIDDHGSRILTSLRDGLRNVQIALNMI
ncbi:hypothetical protein F5Y10DRAFT_247173 [Nemania abortiva]|nr:hypothetical protein F5Y10DRAFT_247173 [Nemania abortiva]